jgi:zinc transport system substrate-binding protein
MKHSYWISASALCGITLMILIWLFSGYAPIHEEVHHDTTLSVVASFYPVYFFAQEVGGEKAHVVNITPTGGEPHDYEPTPQDIAAITHSRLLILVGGVEAWGEKIKQTLDPKKTHVVSAGEGLMTQNVEEDGETIADPHVWLSPVLAQKMVDAIVVGYISVDPANTAYYTQNGESLKTKLADLDMQFEQGLSSCERKDIITSHAAFGYLASAYQLHQVPIAGLSPDAEPSPKQLAEIATFAKNNNVKYVFFERLVSPKLSQTIAHEVGAENIQFDPLEGLTSEDVENGLNYITQMKQNLVNLKVALNCK